MKRLWFALNNVLNSVIEFLKWGQPLKSWCSPLCATRFVLLRARKLPRLIIASVDVDSCRFNDIDCAVFTGGDRRRTAERPQFQKVETEQRAEILRGPTRQDGGRRRDGPVSVQRVRPPAALVVVGEGRSADRRQQPGKSPRGRRPPVHGNMRRHSGRRGNLPDHRRKQIRKNPSHGTSRSVA